MVFRFFFLFALLSVSFCQDSAVEKSLSINEAVRELDLTTQLVKETTQYELENSGSGAVNYFLIAFPKDAAKNLAFAEASQGKRHDGKQKLKLEKTTVKGGSADAVYYRIDLAESLAGGRKVTVEVFAQFTHSLRPYPSHIQQSEQQFVVYEGNLHTLSPYTIKSDKTTVKLAGGSVQSYSKDKEPAKQDGSNIVYGPYENLAPHSQAEMKIHYENNAPFLVVNKLTRLIEVSHWGNIAVEETLEMAHNGALLKGSFSRLDFQKDRREKMPAVRSFKTVLPASARDVYYRDEIGNISTSNMRVMDEAVEMEIRPRFPLFGGWKTNYYIGYNVPSYEYLFATGNDFVLKMRFIDHIFDNFVIDEMTLKIILPEQSKNVKLVPPFKVKRSDDELHHTFLDYSGRPVITAQKNNLVEGHIQDFELHYTFDRMTLLQEPLMVIVAFLLMFLVVIVYVRLDFTISKDAASESRLKAAGILEEAGELQNQRCRAYDAWNDAIAKYKANKDAATLSTGRKKAEADLKQIGQQISDVQTELKTESAESAEKLSDLQRLDKIMRDQMTILSSLTEKLVQGKLQKGAYSDQEKSVRQKLDETREKMENILYSL